MHSVKDHKSLQSSKLNPVDIIQALNPSFRPPSAPVAAALFSLGSTADAPSKRSKCAMLLSLITNFSIFISFQVRFCSSTALAQKPAVFTYGMLLVSPNPFSILQSGTSIHSSSSAFIDDDSTGEGLSIYGYMGTATATPRSELAFPSRATSAASGTRSKSSATNAHFSRFHTNRGSESHPVVSSCRFMLLLLNLFCL